MTATWRSILAGAAAGAAGTTALNTVTYFDMVGRARPTSSTPEYTVEKLADKVGVRIPGTGDERDNRVAGLGPLSGIAVGVGVGALLGVTRSLGWRPSWLLGTTAASILALLGSNGPMTALGITDPRTWSATDWVSDVVPHIAYGAVTHGTVAALVA